MEIHIKLTIDDRLVAAARRARRVFSARTTAVLACLCVLSAAVAVLAAPISKPYTFSAGDLIKASDLNDNFDVLYDELNARVIRNDTTIAAEDCEGVRATLADLDEVHITSAATVTIELAAGTSACEAGSLVIDHPDGSHIQIVGDGSDTTTLTFFKKDGFLIPMSRSVGLIDKLTITGGGSSGDGVVVLGAASAKLGSDFVVSGFYAGVRTEGGFIQADGVISSNNLTDGFAAHVGGTIVATDATARDNAGDGFAAVLGSSIAADGAHAENNGVFGFDANAGAAIQADGAEAAHNQHGFNANANGTVVALGPSASENTDFNYAAWNSGHLGLRMPSSNISLTGFSARWGSFAHVSTPSGATQSYNPPGANMPNAAEDAFVLLD